MRLCTMPGAASAQLAIGLEKSIQGSRSRFDDLQAPFEILSLRGIENRVGEANTQASSDRFDGGQRIIEFVTEYPYQTLPRLALLAKGAAYVGQNDQRVRDAFFTKQAAPHQPARVRSA